MTDVYKRSFIDAYDPLWTNILVFVFLKLFDTVIQIKQFGSP